MTTGTPQRSVLLIGKSQLVLDDTVAALCDLGYTAQVRQPLAELGFEVVLASGSDHVESVFGPERDLRDRTQVVVAAYESGVVAPKRGSGSQ